MYTSAMFITLAIAANMLGATIVGVTATFLDIACNL